MMADMVIFMVLVGLVILLIPCVWQILRAPNQADRLMSVELFSMIITGILVLFAVIQKDPKVIDIAIVLAAFAFIGTVGIARYISEGRMF